LRPMTYAPGPLPPASATLPARPLLDLGGYLPALDGVRGLAILMVLVHHFAAQTTVTTRLEGVVTRALTYGALGVDLFFILSGFLITGILYDSRGQEGYFSRFYMRRVLRIFPLYYLVLAVVFFVLPLVPAVRDSSLGALREHQAWAWLYAVNIYLSIQGGWVLPYIQHFWSLAVEEHFYFVWPFVVWALAGRPRALMKVALATAAVSFLARAAASLWGVNAVAITVLTPFQLDALCLGGFLAVWLRQPGGQAAARRLMLPLAIAAAAVLAFQFGLHRYTDFGLSFMRAVRGGVFRLLFAALLLWALFAPREGLLGRFLGSAPLQMFGKYSYGLYVYHHFLSHYLMTHGTEFAVARWLGCSHGMAVALQAAAGIAVSTVVAWLSYELVEKRFLQLKRYWPSGRKPERLTPGPRRL